MSIRKVQDAYVADTARVVGDVVLGRDANVWYDVSMRGDLARITIGAGTNVQDGAVVHCDAGKPNTIGAGVSIGHRAIVHGIAVGDGSLIAMGAIVLGRSVIGRRCIIAAGAVVTEGTEVPDESVVMGVPGRIVRPISERERGYLADLPSHYVALARLHHESPDDPRVRPVGL